MDKTYTKIARRARAAVCWAAAAAVLALAAACGGATPAADATPTSSGGDGWVELDIDSILADDFGIAIPEAVEPETMPLAQAQQQLPFEVLLPAWLPDGFALQDSVEVVQLPDESGGFASVIISWERGEAALLLQIVQIAEGQPRLGGGGQAEAATVNGQPATLVTGTRLGPEQLTLAWARDGLTYRLTSEGGALSPDELLRAAESIPITPP